MTEDSYCKVYLDTTIDIATVRELLAQLTMGTLKGRSVNSKELTVDVFENKTIVGGRSSDDFAYWPFYLEIEQGDGGVSFDTYLLSLASMLRELQVQGLRVIPSCDFEKQLFALMS